MSASKDNTYVCEVCGEVFIHSFLRGLHARDKHDGWNEMYGCPCYICGEFWESVQMRGQHMRRAHAGFLKAQIEQEKKQKTEENKKAIK